jgi:ATP-dependent protease ClpP protease subunit
MDKSHWGGDKDEFGNFPSEPKGVNGADDVLVDSSNNKIFLYDKISKQSALKFNKSIAQLDDQIRSDSVKQGIYNDDRFSPITVKLNTNGGLISAGVSMMDQILQVECPVITVVEGICASAGTFISVVGDERKITPHSYMLVHQLRTWFEGKYEELEDKKKNMDWLMEMIEGIYEDHTDFDMNELDELMDHDLFLPAERCVEEGLVDEIKGN